MLTALLGPAIAVVVAAVLATSAGAAAEPSCGAAGKTIAKLTVTTSCTVPTGGLKVTDLTVNGGEVDGPGTLTIPTGGTATLENEGSLGNGAHLVNSGTTTIGSFDLIGSSTLENEAAITLQNGTDLVTDGSPNELLNDSTGTITFNGQSSVQSATIDVPMQNAGKVSVGGGILDLQQGTAPVADTGSFSVASGALINSDGGSGAPQILGSGATETGAGTFEVSGYLTVLAGGKAPSFANLTVNGGEVDGPGTLTIPTGGSATLENEGDLGNGAHLVDSGSTSIGEFDLIGSSILDNEGTIELQNGTQIRSDGSANELLNDTSGTVTFDGKSSAQSATIDIPMQNAGKVGVGGGTLDLDGGTASIADTGSFTVASGATIDSDSGSSTPQILGSGATETGAGTFEVSGYLTVLAGGKAPSFANFTVNDGEVDGPGTLIVPAKGKVTLQNDATFRDGCTPRQQRHGHRHGPRPHGELGVREQRALKLPSGAFVGSDGSGVELLNDASGTVTFSGTLAQSASVGVPVTNDGKLSIPAGTLNLSSLTAAPTSTLAVGITSTGAGQLNVSGTASLAGTLAMSTATGYTPAVGLNFPVVSAGTTVGTFTTLKGDLFVDRFYDVTYPSPSVVLDVEQAVAPTITSADTADLQQRNG